MRLLCLVVSVSLMVAGGTAPDTASAPTPPAGATSGTGGATLAAPTGPAATALTVVDTLTQIVAYTYDSVGNRVAVTRSAADGVVIEKVTYVYDGDNRLVKEVSNITGTTTYSHDPAGLLIGSTGYRGDISYSYDAGLRLAAVRSGGRLLMAATYNGDGDRIFQATAIPVTASVTAATGGVSDWLRDQLPDTAGGVFWYAFISTVAEAIAGSNGALMVGMQPGIRTALTLPSQALDPDIPLDGHDIETLATAGIDLAEVTDWIDTIYGTLIPGEIEVSADGWTYQLTHYVNDINTTHTQVLATYGAAGSSVTNYTYGLDRLNSTSTSVDWFLHDGRGSVGQTLTGTSVEYSASYDPWGVPNITMGARSTPHYGYNGEDYNPVTGLQFLRARYYQSATGVFTQPDTYLGDPSDPATLHRYAYCVTDPLNYRDPSGHSMTGDWGPSTNTSTGRLAKKPVPTPPVPIGNTKGTLTKTPTVSVKTPVSPFVNKTMTGVQTRIKPFCEGADMWAGYNDPNYDPMSEQLPPGFTGPTVLNRGIEKIGGVLSDTGELLLDVIDALLDGIDPGRDGRGLIPVMAGGTLMIALGIGECVAAGGSIAVTAGGIVFTGIPEALGAACLTTATAGVATIAGGLAVAGTSVLLKQGNTTPPRKPTNIGSTTNGTGTSNTGSASGTLIQQEWGSIGERGTSSSTRTLATESEVEALFQWWSQGGEVVEKESYGGIWITLPDVTGVGLRDRSKSTGWLKSVDVHLPGESKNRTVHVKQK